MATKKLTEQENWRRSFGIYAKLTNQRNKLAIAQRRYKGARGLGLNLVSLPDKCVLCDETRVLDKCHIFPVWWSSSFQYDDIKVLPHFLRDVMMLCPTHHRLYDRYRLNDAETETLRACFKEYRQNLPKLMKRLKYQKRIKDPKELAIMDKFLEDVWRWWRTYYAY